MTENNEKKNEWDFIEGGLKMKWEDPYKLRIFGFGILRRATWKLELLLGIFLTYCMIQFTRLIFILFEKIFK